MKKSFLIISMAALVYACNSGDKKAESGDTPAAQTTSITDHPDYEKGMNLVAKSDCLGCHKISEASVGPSYNQIGQKYEQNDANINLLAEKITKGGSGVWGTVPMAAHSGLSHEDAVAMVKYIFLLKNEK
jgi:cytochrome c